MESRLQFEILKQPDDTTCGPTCLHAVYRFFGDDIALADLIAETPQLEEGGTLAVLLGCHALRRGYRARIYTYNLRVFDPTWFDMAPEVLFGRLQRQVASRPEDPKLRLASEAYLEFLGLAGELRFEDLTTGLIRRHLKRGVPILTGLSATYLHRSSRELDRGGEMIEDDIAGDPQGHFVVLCGYDPESREVLVADPLWPNPLVDRHVYATSIDRVICAILLGVLTYDANLLILQPNPGKR